MGRSAQFKGPANAKEMSAIHHCVQQRRGAGGRRRAVQMPLEFGRSELEYMSILRPGIAGCRWMATVIIRAGGAKTIHHRRGKRRSGTLTAMRMRPATPPHPGGTHRQERATLHAKVSTRPGVAIIRSLNRKVQRCPDFRDRALIPFNELLL